MLTLPPQAGAYKFNKNRFNRTTKKFQKPIKESTLPQTFKKPALPGKAESTKFIEKFKTTLCINKPDFLHPIRPQWKETNSSRSTDQRKNLCIFLPSLTVLQFLVSLEKWKAPSTVANVKQC